MQEQQKWCEGQKGTNTNGVECAQWTTAPPSCTQPIHGKWATDQGIQRVRFGGGEKTGVYSGFPAQYSLGECSAGMAFHLKEVSKG